MSLDKSFDRGLYIMAGFFLAMSLANFSLGAPGRGIICMAGAAGAYALARWQPRDHDGLK